MVDEQDYSPADETPPGTGPVSDDSAAGGEPAPAAEPIPRDAWIAEVLADAANPRPVQLLSGYVGDAGQRGRTRIYCDPTLTSYVDVADEDVIRHEPLGGDRQPAGGSLVWVRAAEQPAGRAGADFFTGPVLAQHQGAAGGADAAGALPITRPTLGFTCTVFCSYNAGSTAATQCTHAGCGPIGVTGWYGCGQTSAMGCPSTSTCTPQTHAIGCPRTSTCPPTYMPGCPGTSTCTPQALTSADALTLQHCPEPPPFADAAGALPNTSATICTQIGCAPQGPIGITGWLGCVQTSAMGCPNTSTCTPQTHMLGCPSTSTCTPQTHMLGCPSTSTCTPQTHMLGCPSTSTCTPAGGAADAAGPIGITGWFGCTSMMGCPNTSTCTPQTHAFGCPSTSTCTPVTHLIGCPGTSTCSPSGAENAAAPTRTVATVCTQIGCGPIGPTGYLGCTQMLGCPGTSTCTPQTHAFGCPSTSTCPPANAAGPIGVTGWFGCAQTSAMGCPNTSTCTPQTHAFGCPSTSTCTPQTSAMGCPNTSTCTPQTHMFGCPATSTCTPGGGTPPASMLCATNIACTLVC